jgi:hypothetical protein
VDSRPREFINFLDGGPGFIWQGYILACNFTQLGAVQPSSSHALATGEMKDAMQIAMIGLGRMGANIARQIEGAESIDAAGDGHMGVGQVDRGGLLEEAPRHLGVALPGGAARPNDRKL